MQTVGVSDACQSYSVLAQLSSASQAISPEELSVRHEKPSAPAEASLTPLVSAPPTAHHVQSYVW